MSIFTEKKIFEEADNWLKKNKRVSLATVVQTWGSSPLGVGSRMIVSEDGKFLGSISGGCVESKVVEECISLIKNKKVSLATVIQTWGSSPLGVGSRMIVSEDGNFLGSVSGGCIESKVVEECISLIKNKKDCKKIDFKISNENAWEIGLACGGDISIYIEEIK